MIGRSDDRPPVGAAVPLPPGPSRLAILPTVLASRRDPLAIFEACWRRGGDLVRLPSRGGHQSYLVVHPDHVRQVLHDQASRYEKTPMYRQLRRVVGTNLLTAEGADWAWRRRLLQPALRHQQLATAWPLLVVAADQLVERWVSFARAGQPVELLAEMMRFTLSVATRAFFSRDLGPALDMTRAAVMRISPHVTRRMQGYPETPSWLPLPSHRRFVGAVAQLDELARGLIAERRAAAEWPDDVLTLLLQATDPTTGRPLTDGQLRDEILNLLLTGHETTAVGLVWAWALLAHHPDQQARVRQEVANVLGGRPPSVDDLLALEHTRAVVQEALRLYPPVWSFSRRPLADEQLGGYRVPAGTTLFLTPYLTHRHPDFWEQPERFIPERFSRRRAGSETRTAYFPFGAGPRVCIGSTFALGLSTLVLAAVTRRLRVEADGDRPPSPRPIVLLWPRGPARVRPTLA